MTLLVAFRTLAPVVGAPTDADQRRLDMAAEMIFGALQCLSPRVLRGSQEADDIVHKVFCRLLQMGPRVHREGDPASDRDVEGYLGMCLKNGLRDRHREEGRRPGHSLDDPDCGPALEAAIGGGGDGPYLDTLEREQRVLLAQAEAILYERALPDIARTRRATCRGADLFAQTVRDVRDLSRDTLTMQAIMARDQLQPSSTAANTLYQRHKRARREMLDFFPRWFETHPVSAPMDEYVRRLAQRDLTPRVVRTGGA